MNPANRFSAKDSLGHKYFDDIRVKELEMDAPWKIHLGCDEIDGAFDLT